MDPEEDRTLASVAELVVAPDPGAETLTRMIGDTDVLVVRTHLPSDPLERAHQLPLVTVIFNIQRWEAVKRSVPGSIRTDELR